jgi:hypothetical protein
LALQGRRDSVVLAVGQRYHPGVMHLLNG